MISAEFIRTNGKFTGFRFSGHSGYAEAGEDVACAAVSSAVQLIVNLLDEFDCEPQVSTDMTDNAVICRATASENTASAMIEQLRLHLEAVLEEYPETINITISEV
ncbi:MAG: ribosomal-processing cysteine protease Prp [Ruminococcus sp.]|nr:ribosomal-processing cysteine protease Prp [Ruminococcus sp.]